MMVVVKSCLLDGGLDADASGGDCEIIAVVDVVVAIVAATTLWCSNSNNTLWCLGVLFLRAEV